jgi:polyferredoxin
MVKIGKPKGLIRFASYNSIKDGVQKLFTTRVAAYSFVLIFLVSILSFALATRSDVKVTALKVPGTLYQRDGSFITNLYNFEFANKTFTKKTLEMKVVEPTAAVLSNVDGKDIVVPGEGLLKRVFFIKIPESEINNARMVVTLHILENGKTIEAINAKFIGPVHKASDARRK